MRFITAILIGILLGVFPCPQAMGVVVVVVQPAGGGAAPSYLLQENFETTPGYDLSWTEDQGDPNPDYSTSGLSMEGSECLFCGGATNNADQRAYVGFTPTAAQPQEAFFLFRTPAALTITGDKTIAMLTTSAGTARLSLYVDSGGRFSVQSGGGTLVDTVATISANTTYYVWLRYTKVVVANDAVASVGFSTDGTRPTSGNNYAESTNGTGTTDAARLYLVGDFGTNTTNEMDCIFDKVRIDDATIGDNPS